MGARNKDCVKRMKISLSLFLPPTPHVHVCEPVTQRQSSTSLLEICCNLKDVIEF